jgi:hypothetical protein
MENWNKDDNLDIVEEKIYRKHQSAVIEKQSEVA